MKTLVTSILLSLFLSSCAHNFMRGTVAMKTTKDTVHVCLGNNDVKVGETLDFLTNECTEMTVGRGAEGVESRECTMRTLGTGKVTRLLNSHYSEVKTDGSFKIPEGTLVQKQK